MSHLPPTDPAQKPLLVESTDLYPVRSLLSCAGCQQTFFGTTLADGSRAYRSRCGCRLHPLPAREVEHRVYAQTLHHLYTNGGALLCDCLPLLAGRLFSTVTVGTTTDNITFTPRHMTPQEGRPNTPSVPRHNHEQPGRSHR